jgi:hypothetical protein
MNVVRITVLVACALIALTIAALIFTIPENPPPGIVGSRIIASLLLFAICCFFGRAYLPSERFWWRTRPRKPRQPVE